MLADPSVSSYGPDEGLPALRQALVAKVAAENGLPGHDVHVTAGANQAFASVVLALLDPGDASVLFAPYYFNHHMALQMTGCGGEILYGPCHPDTFHPDLDWLATTLRGPRPPKLVVICNPCNPTGALLSADEVRRAADLCAAAGSWLVLDSTCVRRGGDAPLRQTAAAPRELSVYRDVRLALMLTVAAGTSTSATAAGRTTALPAPTWCTCSPFQRPTA
jgi:histidinol-phosphate/aromatic aminotransferase/cobyric acid decarboxylase-like protein